MIRLEKYKYIDFDDFDIEETDMESPLTDSRFVKFLKRNKIHDRFINNIKRETTKPGSDYSGHWSDAETFCDDIKDINYIFYAFDWESTPEGRFFWKKYNDEWMTIISKD